MTKTLDLFAGKNKKFSTVTPTTKTLDLFAGIGGIRLAFEAAGFNTVFGNDFEQQCKATYDLNFDVPKLTLGDLTKLEIDDLPDFDLLLGGFPCQSFSVAGYKKGFEDEGRGDLFFHISKILSTRKPLGFFLENVKNLYGHDFGRTFKTILSQLDKIGYAVKFSVLNTKEYGNLPQNRERIYIIGFKKETGLINNFHFPEPLKLTKSVSDILLGENKVDSFYYYDDKPLYRKLKHFDFKQETIYQWRRQYLRENKNGVCPTLTANTGTGGHNVPLIKDRRGIRKLTPRECARFQGFPDDYKFPNIADCHLYKQIGNSVSIPVVKRIAKQIERAMA